MSAERSAAPHIAAAREHFTDAVKAAGWPDGACLFLTGGDDQTGTSHPDDVHALYFSPVSVSTVPHLIALYRAAPSPAPPRGRAVLLVGTENDWNLLPREAH